MESEQKSTRIPNLRYVTDAILAVEGKITYDSIIYFNEQTRGPFHYYFMSGLHELAYYTPGVEALMIHNVDIVWEQDDYDMCVKL
jgi:hypothetical protein